MYIYIYTQAPSVQAYKWVNEVETMPPDFPKDAVHGMNRTPDVHLYFQWLRSEDDKGYSHFDMLLHHPNAAAAGHDIIQLPGAVDHFSHSTPLTHEITACSADEANKANAPNMYRFFDTSTYKGKTRVFEPMIGKLKPAADEESFMIPAIAAHMHNLFQKSTPPPAAITEAQAPTDAAAPEATDGAKHEAGNASQHEAQEGTAVGLNPTSMEVQALTEAAAAKAAEATITSQPEPTAAVQALPAPAEPAQELQIEYASSVNPNEPRPPAATSMEAQAPTNAAAPEAKQEARKPEPQDATAAVETKNAQPAAAIMEAQAPTDAAAPEATDGAKHEASNASQHEAQEGTAVGLNPTSMEVQAPTEAAAAKAADEAKPEATITSQPEPTAAVEDLSPPAEPAQELQIEYASRVNPNEPHPPAATSMEAQAPTDAAAPEAKQEASKPEPQDATAAVETKNAQPAEAITEAQAPADAAAPEATDGAKHEASNASQHEAQEGTAVGLNPTSMEVQAPTEAAAAKEAADEAKPEATITSQPEPTAAVQALPPPAEPAQELQIEYASSVNPNEPHPPAATSMEAQAPTDAAAPEAKQEASKPEPQDATAAVETKNAQPAAAITEAQAPTDAAAPEATDGAKHEASNASQHEAQEGTAVGLNPTSMEVQAPTEAAAAKAADEAKPEAAITSQPEPTAAAPEATDGAKHEASNASQHEPQGDAPETHQAETKTRRMHKRRKSDYYLSPTVVRRPLVDTDEIFSIQLKQKIYMSDYIPSPASDEELMELAVGLHPRNTQPEAASMEVQAPTEAAAAKEAADEAKLEATITSQPEPTAAVQALPPPAEPAQELQIEYASSVNPNEPHPPAATSMEAQAPTDAAAPEAKQEARKPEPQDATAAVETKNTQPAEAITEAQAPADAAAPEATDGAKHEASNASQHEPQDGTSHHEQEQPTTAEEQKLFRLFQRLLQNNCFHEEQGDQNAKTQEVKTEPALLEQDENDHDREEEHVCDDSGDGDSPHLVLRLSQEVMSYMMSKQHREDSMILLSWKQNLQDNTQVCFVDPAKQSKIIVGALLQSITAINNFASLRSHPLFKVAAPCQRTAWRKRVLEEKKPLYSWVFTHVQEFDIPLMLPPFRGRSSWVKLGELARYQDQDVPGLDLQETCKFFVNRLSSQDRQKLGERLQSLDGCEVVIGSTCSGTDICVSIMQATMQKLSQMFEVDIRIRHGFSVEIDPFKRNFILEAHTPAGSKPDFHLFEDVSIFKDGSGHCYTCGHVHNAPDNVDILFVGPSCKNLSKMFEDRQSFLKCYESGEGSSGHTYLHGVLEASRATSPAMIFFENVTGVAESGKVNGVKVAPPIKANDYLPLCWFFFFWAFSCADRI